MEVDTKAEIQTLTKELGGLIAQLQQLDRQREQLVADIQGRQFTINYLKQLDQNKGD